MTAWDPWYADEGWEHDAHRMTFEKEETMPREPFGPEWAPVDDADRARVRLEVARAEDQADPPTPEEL